MNALLKFVPARCGAVVITALSFVLCIAPDALARRKKAFIHKSPPDLTKGEKPDDTHDWRLGPIGGNGWVFNLRTGSGASALARQIQITRVDTDGPAAGKLKVGDVIVGIGGKKFTYDARKALAAAINEAEKNENSGRLPLLVWRAGKNQQVVLTLPVMGSYSKTHPFNCRKTDKIVDQACDYLKSKIEKQPLKDSWIDCITALGMLSTGKPEMLPQIKAFAHRICLKPGETLSVEKHVPMKCWHWSYKTLFLCEYYLYTKDRYVQPTITEYLTKIAMGQSGAGTWGHTYASRENNGGRLHGHLGGYGAINQQGLTLMVCLALADKCGVRNKEVRDAVRRGNDFFGYFIGKGTIPYGDHGPAREWFDDNGKSGSAAVFFDLMGNRKGAKFFSTLLLGSAPSGREQGHTGCFWSHMWGGVGAARGGDLGLQAYMSVMNWAFTLERQPNGRMVFQGNAGEAGDKGDLKTKWDCTGVRLLDLCVPRRKLYITGKATPRETEVTRERIKQIFAVGRLAVDQEARKKLTRERIFQLMGDPLPAIRSVGVKAMIDTNLECAGELIHMLDSTNRYVRYGAAEALGKVGKGNKQAADKLIKLMESDDDIQLRLYAINALIRRDKKMGLITAARPAIPVMLRMAAKTTPEDPREVLQATLSMGLFYNGGARPNKGLCQVYGLNGIDRALLVPAMEKILTNQNGVARSDVRYIYSKLTPADLKLLWGSIYKSVRTLAPSGIMFASEVRTEGLKLMAKHHVEEGIDLCAWYIRYQKHHGNRRRVPIVLDALLQYGAYAKRTIPELEKHAAYYKEQGGADTAKAIQETIKKIQAMPRPTFKLVSIAKYINDK